MPNINIAVSEDLLRLVKVECAQLGLTQKQFMIQLLQDAVNETGRDRTGPNLAEAKGKRIARMSKNEYKEWAASGKEVPLEEGDIITTAVPGFEGPHRIARPLMPPFREPGSLAHAEACKCFICKPPKEK